MADVVIRITLDKDTKDWLDDMIPAAVSNALSRAAAAITKYAKEIVPRRTGRLAESVKVATTDRSIHMLWDAVDPISGYHYAKVVDVGRGGGEFPTRTVIAQNPWPFHFFDQRTGEEVYTWKYQQGGFSGARFTDHMRIVAPQFVREAIIQELQGMNPT
jgi:hypothetical protein